MVRANGSRHKHILGDVTAVARRGSLVTIYRRSPWGRSVEAIAEASYQGRMDSRSETRADETEAAFRSRHQGGKV